MLDDIKIGDGSITLSTFPGDDVKGLLYFMASDPAYYEEVSLEDAKRIVRALVITYGPKVLENEDS